MATPRLNGAVIRALLIRATIAWFGVRFAMAYLGVVRITPASLVFLVLCVTAVVLVDARARHEEMLLANLGRSRWTSSLIVGVWAGGLEAAVSSLLRAFL